MVLLKTRGLGKSFGAVQALSGVSLEFSAGTVHAVVGQNGAGKSTLVNLLGGFLKPDNGAITMEAKPAIVHQHFMLVPEFSVRENLALDRMDHRGGLVPPVPDHEDLPMDARTGDLPVGRQQRVEIVKALATDAQILILDEPTAVLSEAEIEELIALLRRLASEGKAVILIAHKLDEIFAAADQISVLRGGELVLSGAADALSREQVLEAMVGELPEHQESEGQVDPGEIVIEAQGLRVKGQRGEERVRGLDLQVRSGEIVGIGGVDGNGQEELAEALARVRPCKGKLKGPTPAYIPPDRQRDGLVLAMPIWENLLIGRPFPRRAVALQEAERLREEYAIKAPDVQTRAGDLSGGNQQRIVVARALADEPEALVAVNPTRGLDVRATQFVRGQIRSAAQRGAAVVLISSDRDELAELATRALTMESGQVEP